MAEMTRLLEVFHLEWWQAFLVILVVGIRPLFKAAAVILVARFVKPEIVKVALPLIFSPRIRLESKPRHQVSKDVKLID